MPRRRGSVGLALALVAALVAAAALFPGTPAAAKGCAHADSQANQATARQLRRATLCLINQARTARGLSPLALNLHLTDMATRHTKTMLAEHCFRHTCRGEDPLPKRLKKSGYLAGAKKWVYAEDLGFEQTPRQMVARWLHSDFDRRNILGRKYADIGLGLRRGSPKKHSPHGVRFLTYTADLAARTPPA
jgi:uncharacterized protein YkwD